MKYCNIVKILCSKQSIEAADSSFSDVEYLVADIIEKDILQIVKTGKIPQSFVDLQIKGSDLLDDSSDSSCTDDEDSDDDEEYTPPVKKPYSPLPYSLEDMVKIIELYDDPDFHGNRFKRVTNRYRRIQSRRQISRIREQVQKSGSRYYKVRELDKLLFEQFKNWKNEKQVIRDRDLIDAALYIAEDVGFVDFKASESWLLSFKKKHRIVGRKITQIVTVKEPNAQADIQKLGREFVERAKVTIDNKPPSKVFNSDQMGLQLEMTSGRTLAFQGEKKVEAAVQSKNATSHSLTVQPVINASGKLFLPVLTCFYEPNGPLQCFDSNLAEFKNLRCVSSTSGKMTKKLMKDWMKTDFLPVAEKHSILLLDSWTGFNEAKVIAEVKKKGIEILTIPPKTTGKIQPCDVGFFRYVKAIIRTAEDKIRRLHPTYMLAQRKNLGRLLNQIFEQLAAPRFHGMITHAFIKSGYFDIEYEAYETPDKYCFEFKKIGARCETDSCSKLAFIKCSWCEKHLCFDDFLMQLHCCRNGISS